LLLQDQQQLVIWNLWVGSQSHKCESFCSTNPREKSLWSRRYMWSC